MSVPKLVGSARGLLLVLGIIFDSKRIVGISRTGRGGGLCRMEKDLMGLWVIVVILGRIDRIDPIGHIDHSFQPYCWSWLWLMSFVADL